MKKKQPKWKPIKMGERLPCQSFLRKKDGEILKLSTGAGIKVGQDAYYLPVDDVIEEIKNYPIEESEDERMIRVIMNALTKVPYSELDGLIPDTIRIWIERKFKQGEQKPYGQREECLDCQMNYAGECKGICALKRNKQKPADKVEPKFKVGDKIYLKPEYRMPDDDTPIANTVKEIRRIDDKYYRFDRSYIFIEDQDKYELVEQKPIKTCAEYYNKDSELKMPELSVFQNKLADILMQREYEGSTETEEDVASARLDYELAAIRISEELLPLAIMQKPAAWSEEDERIRTETIELLETANHPNKMHSNGKPLDFTEKINWLKSLKDRYTWKPSDEQMEALLSKLPVIKGGGDKVQGILESLYNDLKKLK